MVGFSYLLLPSVYRYGNITHVISLWKTQLYMKEQEWKRQIISSIMKTVLPCGAPERVSDTKGPWTKFGGSL